MSIFNLEFESWHTLLIRFNWLLVFIAVILTIAAINIIKKLGNQVRKKKINVDEVVLGIGSNSIKLSYNRKDQEIAYKIWVELSTRKIGIPFDEKNDVIEEVYDSWYEFFRIVRELLKEVPASNVSSSNELIMLTEKVLNDGLRPHLTEWQAKFRNWYDNAPNDGSSRTPQEIQKTYSLYNALIDSLKKTNKKMIEYKELMREIAFD